MEIDHLFILCDVGAPEADALTDLGFVEGSSNVHPGQGTACRRFFCETSYLELLWVERPDEAQAEPARGTGLWERWSRRANADGGGGGGASGGARSGGRDGGASPFGIVLRPSSDAEGVVGAPFAAESYAPDYMPAGISIGVAAGVPLGEPACFWLPFQRGRARQGIEPAAHAEARVITGVRVSLPSHPASPGATMRDASVQSEAARAVERAGLIAFVQATEHLLDLTLDDARHHRTADLRPHLPLRLHW